MISLFRKFTASRPAWQAAVTTGILALAAFAPAPFARAQSQAATRIQLASQRNNGVLSLTATVNDVMGRPVSEGSVSFQTPRGSLGSVFVHNGSATLNLTNPPAWARDITAVYDGDSAFAPASVSTTVVSDATAPVPGFTVTATPSSFSVAPGQFGMVNLTVTSVAGFSEQVNLSCGNLPANSTCNFNPVIVTPPANGSAVSTLEVNTSANSGILSSRLAPRGRSATAWAFVLPGLLALAGIGAIRRKHFGALRVLGMALLLAAGSLGLTACNPRYNYEHYKPAPNYGTPAGSYTVVISAYASNGTAITQATSSDPNCSGAVCLAMTVK